MTMNRCLGWAALVTLGILLGAMSSSYRQTSAEPTTMYVADAGDASAAATAEQLKEIKTQLKDIDNFLRTGTIKVVVVMR